VDLDRRRLAQAQQRVAIEVLLLHAAPLDGDLAVQGGAEPVEHPALHLGVRAAQVHHLSTIHGHHDPIDSHAAFGLVRDLHHVRGVAAEGEMSRDAAGPAG
jgi:hypothetical protein